MQGKFNENLAMFFSLANIKGEPKTVHSTPWGSLKPNSETAMVHFSVSVSLFFNVIRLFYWIDRVFSCQRQAFLALS